MKTPVLEGKNVRLIPFILPVKTSRQIKRIEKFREWGQTSPSIPGLARENHKRREARFVMRTIGEDRMVGYITLDGFDWSARSGWLGIGMGDPDGSKRGYTHEATQLILDFAFKQLCLNRVNLNLLSCDEREIRRYEDMGFRYEGTQREVVVSENERLDIIDLGILRGEWELLNRYPLEEER